MCKLSGFFIKNDICRYISAKSWNNLSIYLNINDLLLILDYNFTLNTYYTFRVCEPKIEIIFTQKEKVSIADNFLSPISEILESFHSRIYSWMVKSLCFCEGRYYDKILC